MYAVTDKVYTVYFGGSYRECWSENYVLSIAYEGQRSVSAAFSAGQWRAVGGDGELVRLLSSADCPALTQLYFQAAATAYHAAQECLRLGLPLSEMAEAFRFSGNALVAPELMRLLMDDCGFSMDLAYGTVVRCCEDQRAGGISIAELSSLQPRTAQVISLLRKLSAERLFAEHDSADRRFRSPAGALPAGEEVTLSVRVRSGRVKGITLVLLGDGLHREQELRRCGDLWSATLKVPEAPAALWYHFRIESHDGPHFLCPDGGGHRGALSVREREGFRLTVYKKDFDTPAWFRRSILYQIFPDRFAFSDDGTFERGIEYHRALGQSPVAHKSLSEPVKYLPSEGETDYSPNDFYGGTLKGIEKKLPYLAELGISCLYLNPICEARSNHRYDTADYLRPDPILGTTEDFVSLCAAAKCLGIRVILDGVFSHTGADSRYFNRYGHYVDRGACQGADSPYYEWYDFKDFPEEYRCWWGYEDLPEVEEMDDKYLDFILKSGDSVVKTWLRRGSSGWRLDVADELPDEFLSLLRECAKAEKPDALILGEVWEDAVIKKSYGARRNYALGCSLDSVMNYPLRTAVLDFVHRRTTAYALRDFLIAQQQNYPKPLYYSLMNLLSSHDVDRLRTALSTDVFLHGLTREEQMAVVFSGADCERAKRLERLCAALQFSLPGVPGIYYGEEQGMTGLGDPFNRAPFVENDRDLHDYYVNLCAFRNSHPVLSTGHASFFALSASLLCILRYTVGGKDAFGDEMADAAVLTVINIGTEAADFEADCSAAGCGPVRGTVEAESAEILLPGG